MSSPPPRRVALVTGAAQGIGRGISIRLAADGLDVALNDIEPKRAALEELASEIRAKGMNALVLAADCTVEKEVESMIDKVVLELGGLDVMVANAGIGKTTTLIDSSLADWTEVMSVNVRGVFLCYRAAAVQMIKQGRGGRIIGASSICGKKGYANLPAYCASKFAVRGLTQSAAQELGRYGITVNAYAPGVIETEMTGGYGKNGDYAKKIMNIPDSPTGQPEDIASLVSYIAKPEAHFITGQSIIVDGGVQFD